ncbi:MAG: hypothetical protein SPL41_01285 [Succinivibrionaceae bacterium]|jgi:hypothetical protein|nr:hypothetical protein [Succinivibrionaceae bacterium]MDY6273630.1 hypothetical protein [Succinivibrionaceae bacterium]MDY6335610.1 hypothetical protein [Succinivibrionaceae bacterium]MDY6375373.1 hypothetical protein [Succinivibrionaceae bacterium]
MTDKPSLLLAAAILAAAPLAAISAEAPEHVPFSELRKGPVAGSFTESKIMPGAERALETRGSFMTSPQKLCWKMEKPFVKAFEFSDGTARAKAPGGVVRTIEAGGPGRLIADLLSGLASGGLEGVKDDFTLASEEKTSDGFVYELTPQSAMMKKALRSVRLTTAGGRFSEFSIADQGGGSTVMKFSGTGELSPEQFDSEFPRFCDVH